MSFFHSSQISCRPLRPSLALFDVVNHPGSDTRMLKVQSVLQLYSVSLKEGIIIIISPFGAMDTIYN